MPITALLFQSTLVEIEPKNSLRLDVWFPRLISNALIVYRLTPRLEVPGSCSGETSR